VEVLIIEYLLALYARNFRGTEYSGDWSAVDASCAYGIQLDFSMASLDYFSTA